MKRASSLSGCAALRPSCRQGQRKTGDHQGQEANTDHCSLRAPDTDRSRSWSDTCKGTISHAGTEPRGCLGLCSPPWIRNVPRRAFAPRSWPQSDQPSDIYLVFDKLRHESRILDSAKPCQYVPRGLGAAAGRDLGNLLRMSKAWPTTSAQTVIAIRRPTDEAALSARLQQSRQAPRRSPSRFRSRSRRPFNRRSVGDCPRLPVVDGTGCRSAGRRRHRLGARPLAGNFAVGDDCISRCSVSPQVFSMWRVRRAWFGQTRWTRPVRKNERPRRCGAATKERADPVYGSDSPVPDQEYPDFRADWRRGDSR